MSRISKTRIIAFDESECLLIAGLLHEMIQSRWQ